MNWEFQLPQNGLADYPGEGFANWSRHFWWDMGHQRGFEESVTG